ncbi:MAG: phosphohistidine phosphatase SixA [Oligoflexia bacterium]|nr:phosphohistidine phosphatase SixA [Oligoflexia bacterium]
MQLHLVRHGNATQSSQSATDFSRALSNIGITEVESLATKIREQILLKKIFVDKIYHSGLLRAKETAEIIYKAVAIDNNDNNDDIDIEVCEELSPDYGNYRYVIDKLINCSENGGIMLVGHMPSLSKIGHYLLSDKIDLSFDTANMISLEWSRDDEEWKFLGKITPRDQI